MSSVLSERQQALILEFLANRLPEHAFFREFPVSPGGPSENAVNLLKQAALLKDPIGVEFGLHLGHRFGFSPEANDVLCELAVADYHERHEDVVDALSVLRSPASVDALYAAATSQHRYRDYDEAHSLEVKAARALKAIGTLEAVAKLGLLLRTNNVVVAAAARRQIEHLAASASTDAVRELARHMLVDNDQA
jgi:HEAT repeat protein